MRNHRELLLCPCEGFESPELRALPWARNMSRIPKNLLDCQKGNHLNSQNVLELTLVLG